MSSITIVFIWLFQVTVCCFGVVTSFFLNVSVSIPYNVTLSNGTFNWTEMVNGTFNGLSANTPAGISQLFMSNLYPNYKQVHHSSGWWL
jgi:hypothetical protein